MISQLRLGKTPARQGAIKFSIDTYTDTSSLPATPVTYGHQGLISTWGMFGNDRYGDCVWAGAAHEHMLWNKEANKDVSFTDNSVLSAYSTVTGFNPNDPSTDQGTDMELAAKFRRQTGILDSNNVRHKISAYLNLPVGNETKIKQATYLFSGVGLGFQFPDVAMDQFNQGKPWTVVSRAHIEGGHYTPIVGYDAQYVYLVTWGKIQKATWQFVLKYMDEGIVYLNGEFFINGKTMEGLDVLTLQKDLNKL